MEQLFLVALILVVERELWRQRNLYEGICTRNEMKHATYSCSYSKLDCDYALVAFTSSDCRCAVGDT